MARLSRFRKLLARVALVDDEAAQRAELSARHDETVKLLHDTRVALGEYVDELSQDIAALDRRIDDLTDEESRRSEVADAELRDQLFALQDRLDRLAGELQREL